MGIVVLPYARLVCGLSFASGFCHASGFGPAHEHDCWWKTIVNQLFRGLGWARPALQGSLGVPPGCHKGHPTGVQGCAITRFGPTDLILLGFY